MAPSEETLSDQCVYVLNLDNRCKIGRSNDPEARCRAIATASGLPITLAMRTVNYKKKTAGIIERVTHKLLNDDRLKGEWFAVTPEKAEEAVRKAEELVKSNKHESVLKPKEWDDYKYQILNVVLKPSDASIVMQLRHSFEKENLAPFSQSDIVRIALRDLARVRGLSCN